MMTPTMSEVKKASEERYLRQVQYFNNAGKSQPRQEQESFGFDEPILEEKRISPRSDSDLNRDRKAVNVLMNYIELLELEMRRNKIKIRSLSRELFKSKKELNSVREDRDYWIKQHTEDMSRISTVDSNSASALMDLKNEILSIKNQLAVQERQT